MFVPSHLKNIRTIFIQVLFFSFFFIAFVQAMIFDNRYFPLMQYPYITAPGKESHITGDFFITTASRAADDKDRDIGIPELSGQFDQAQLAYSMQLAGVPLPLLFPLVLVNGELPWSMMGKLQSQGFAFSYQQYLGYCVSFGVLGLVMRSNSSIEFFFNSTKASGLGPDFSENDIFLLDDSRRQMLATLGLSCNHVQQVGIGDIETYGRWCQHYEYCFKLRTLDYGLRFGALIPTGVKRDINKPASVPFGGNGHWGVYTSIDCEAELKEDWKVGFLIRASKRFAKTRLERMPVARAPVKDIPNPSSEPQIFGVVVGPAQVNPGWSEIFYLYTQWEGIRQGLGVRLQYTLVNHNRDNWTDERIDKTIPVNLEQIERRSSWASEYVTLSAFYDFGKTSLWCDNQPIVRVAWDIPFTLLVGHRFVHSYKVSLGLEFNF